MKTVRFTLLVLLSVIFTFFASCNNGDLSMNPAVSSPEIAKLSLLDTLVLEPRNREPIDRLTPIGKLIIGYTYVESEIVTMSWKYNYLYQPFIVQTEAEYLNVFNGPVNVDLDKYTVVATRFRYNVGHVTFNSSFYFKNNEPTTCRWYLDDISENVTYAITDIPVVIIVPKMEIKSVELFGGGYYPIYQTE